MIIPCSRSFSVCTAQAADHVYDHAWLYVFSASMWTGQTLGDSLDLSGFIGSLILGGIILAIYTGSLAYVGRQNRTFPGSAGTAFLWCKGLPICRLC